MRMPTIRILLATLCMLLFGSALAAGSSPAHAAPKDVVTVNNPGAQTDPVGAAVNLQIQAKDTSALPLIFSAAILPPGLTINAATGLISGTITAQFNGNVTVKATDGLATGKATFPWTAAGNKVTVTAPTVEQSWVGVPVNVKVTATDSGGAAVTYSAKGLPAGLSINAGSGVITGSPQRITAGVTATVSAADGTGSFGTAQIKWSVGYAIIIPDPGKVTVKVGLAVNVPITYTDHFGAGTRVTLSATGLPRGVSFRPNAPLVYGWPVTAGTYTVTIHAKDSHGGTSVMTFPLVARFAANGPAGQIRLALNGKCLTDPGNRTGNGTRVNVANCQPGAAQHWTAAADGTLRVHNRCLDIAGNGGAAGQPAQLWQCAGSTREMWMQGTAGELVNPASGLCLTSSGSSTKMGACRIRRGEEWTLPARPVLASVPGKCMDDLHSVGNNGNPVDMYSCNGTPIQNWTFEPDGSIRVYGNKCVTLRTLGRVGTKVVLWTCGAGNRGQHWSVVRTGYMSAELSIGGVCLAVPSMTAADGTQLVTGRCTATDPRVHWHIW
jgi:Ricin-type beta-trefoil lectin domain/Putative Ig domain